MMRYLSLLMYMRERARKESKMGFPKEFTEGIFDMIVKNWKNNREKKEGEGNDGS